MHDHKSGRSPILSVPEVIFPDTHIDHAVVIDEVRKQYEPLLHRYPDDPEYRREFTYQVEVALRMCGALSVDAHPVHLPLAEILRPRGWRVRNAQALDAFLTYAPLAAKQAMATAQVSAADIDAVLVETSTVISMPTVAYDVVAAVGLRPTTEVIPVYFMGCNGGAHAIVRARDYLLAHPTHTILIIAADYASPHFHVEEDLRGNALRGSVVSATLFSDATAAAVMSAHADIPGFRIVGTSSSYVPGTREALSWEVGDDGLHFRLTDMAMKLVPEVIPGISALLAEQGWHANELSLCSFHSGGNRVIKNVQEALGLTDSQVQPTRESLRHGNTMSVAVFDALRIIASDVARRPPHGGRGIGAGFGPGFSCSAFAWTYHDPGEVRPLAA
jgi:predicted naringenin-chalcone synthase